MLARVIATALYLAVSVTSRCSVERDGRIELVFGMGLLLTYPTLYYNEIPVSKMRLLPSFISSVEKCHKLSSTEVDAHSVIN